MDWLMGLSNYMLEGVVREHCYRPIGDVVIQIGRQTIELTGPEMFDLFARYNVPLATHSKMSLEVDRHTTQVRQTGAAFVSDHAFFGALDAKRISAVDHSDFEGADIIHDMNEPIGTNLESIADLVLDGSTLDNVYDPAVALMNYNRMLRPGGRVVSINAAKADVQGAYTGMPIEWFLDYYAINDYKDCRVYAQVNFPAARWAHPSGPVALLALDYDWMIEQGSAPQLIHEGWAFAIVVAEKGEDSSWDRVPAQAGFRNSAEQAHWLAAIRRFAISDRPSFFTTMRPDFAPPAGFVAAV
jgi:SAM-dependent methyltransferase